MDHWKVLSPQSRRRILCAFPRYSKSFGTFNHAFPLMGNVKAFMPPQGILLIAALVPREWEVRFVDENIRPITAEEFAWADAVFVSGMHIQRTNINDLNRRAHVAGKLTVLGGPSVSAAPETYSEFDILHCGEAGDATWKLFSRIDSSIERLGTQEIYRTVERLPMTEFPCPAYHLIDIMQYLLGCVQFSSGCPFTCEFCDIPRLYGRNPRHKTPEQVLVELDALADGGTPSVYFVDDNFIGNPKATLELLPHLVEWQKRRNYQVRLSCEATLNMAQHPAILRLMREAFMIHVFCGIETPEPDALRAMKKTQNLRTPVLEAVATLNSYGIEVASGIIMGLDTDTPQTPQAVLDFAEASNIPIMTMNLLHALPNTALYERLQREGRLNSGAGRDSNIEFLRPYDEVVRDWKRVIREAYAPEKLYARYAAQSIQTYPNRIKPPAPLKQLTWFNVKRALNILRRLIWRVGICSDYRRVFWKMAWTQLKKGHIENIFQISMVAHHLIMFSRDVVDGEVHASHYSARELRQQAADVTTATAGFLTRFRNWLRPLAKAPVTVPEETRLIRDAE